MKPSEYFDKAKATLGITSDYELAQKMGLPRQSIPAMRKGTRAVPLKAAYWLALTLNLDPSEVVADLEAQRETNPQALEFWRSFLTHARHTAAVIALCMLGAIMAVSGSATPEGVSKMRLWFRRLYIMPIEWRTV